MSQYRSHQAPRRCMLYTVVHGMLVSDSLKAYTHLRSAARRRRARCVSLTHSLAQQVRYPIMLNRLQALQSMGRVGGQADQVMISGYQDKLYHTSSST